MATKNRNPPPAPSLTAEEPSASDEPADVLQRNLALALVQPDRSVQDALAWQPVQQYEEDEPSYAGQDVDDEQSVSVPQWLLSAVAGANAPGNSTDAPKED